MIRLGVPLLVLMILGFGLPRDKDFEVAKNIELFTGVFKEIFAGYVDDLDPSTLMKTGIDAMLKTLDPYTIYISESQIENYRLKSEVQDNGIGATVKLIEDALTITEIYKDYSADRAGMKIGDQILAVNGLHTDAKSPDQLYAIMKGSPKSALQLEVKRGDELLNIELIRDDYKQANVPYSGWASDGIGYIHLTQFTQGASQNILKAFKKLKSEKTDMRGLILDLRNNGGGLLHEAVEICNIFVPKDQLIVSTRSKSREEDQLYKTRRDPYDDQISLVVLINSSSASASEIVSGTMQDLDRAVVIGQLSFGKGLVQKYKKLGYNSQVKLTVSKYYIPSGRCIQAIRYKDGRPEHLPEEERARFKTQNGRTVLDGGGILPDIKVESSESNPLIKNLLDDAWIFRYVSQLTAKQNAVLQDTNYQHRDFEAFISFLKSNNYDFKPKIEAQLLKLKEKAKTDEPDYLPALRNLKSRMDQDQWTLLNSKSEEINHHIIEEIRLRQNYAQAKTQYRFSWDPVMKEALSVLSDTERYRKILNP